MTVGGNDLANLTEGFMEGKDHAELWDQTTEYMDLMRDAVDWLWSEDLTTGKTPTIYGVGDPLTRADFATFLFRLVGEPEGAPVSPFVDVDRPTAELDELLSVSDVVSLHVPATPETLGLLDARRLGLLGPGAILVNCARGEIIDVDAVAGALRGGTLLGAGIDVWPSEPAPADHPLLAFDSVVATPHTAGAVYDNVGHVSAHAFRNMRRLIDGEPLPGADVIVPIGN